MAKKRFVTSVGKNLTYKMKNLYSPVYTRVYMAKLYWRVKRDGKWTWLATCRDNSRVDMNSKRFFNLEYKEDSE